MKILLNGVPWDSINVPDGTEAVMLSAQWSNALDFGLQTRALDEMIYYVMRQDPVTEQLYRASCWAVESILDSIF